MAKTKNEVRRVYLVSDSEDTYVMSAEQLSAEDGRALGTQQTHLIQTIDLVIEKKRGLYKRVQKAALEMFASGRRKQGSSGRPKQVTR